MDIQRLFEDAVTSGIFTDFDVCVRGSKDFGVRGGKHIHQGAKLFDVSSLTKAVTWLLLWKMFVDRRLSPENKFGDLLSVPGVGERRLWHFMSYAAKSYAFDYGALRNRGLGPFKDVLLKAGFGDWRKEFEYDNIASAYMGLMLEEYFGDGIESILHRYLLCDRSLQSRFLFHPVRRGSVQPDLVVPTRTDENLRGLVHDPLSFAHPRDNIVAAGLFSDAETIANLFHRVIGEIVTTYFFERASQNQLSGLGITDHEYALGFDIPYQSSLQDILVDRPLLFAGWTGCRIFFARNPRVTICILTNRVLCGDNTESQKAFSEFSRGAIREILRAQS